MTATTPLLIPGLSVLAPSYRAILCDVWGVLHNGVAAFAPACEALAAFRRETGAPVVLITNAPRPNPPVKAQLASLGVPRDAFDEVVTSGDVTRDAITALDGAPIQHIGPERDLTLFEGFANPLVGEEDAQAVVCTGLVDDENETPESYRPAFERMIARGLTFICANPDIVVERGDKLVWCAGALARLYEDMGGKVTIVGKPHTPIYNLAIARAEAAAGAPLERSSILAIGDGLPTDIRGAYANSLDVLFITGGIHGADFGPTGAPEEDLVRKRLAEEGLRARAAIPELRW
uniref:TIGR01459 family HAD-type hydrolase n=1 Tax=Stappia sp. TaxID=1870903 RepID=UPI003BAC1EF4